MAKRSIEAQRGFFPQPAYLIGTYKEEEKPNFALITWITFCSVNPPLLMFASRGKKLTRELVEKNRMFSVNLVTANMMDTADFFGTHSGFTSDKGDRAGSIKGSILEVPVLNDSPWVYECTLKDVIMQGDGAIYIGKIKNILVEEKITGTGYGQINLLDIDPLIYAPGGYYRVKEKIGNVGDSKDK